MLAPLPNSPPFPLVADDLCDAAFGGADPTGPRKYYRARYYDPKIGRFISEDPIGFVGGVNFYVYADNRPTVFVDPSGLQFAPGQGYQPGKGYTPAGATPIPPAPEYMTFSCQLFYVSTNASWVFGGHGFGGSGVGFPKGCGCYLTFGSLDGPGPHTPKEVDAFINGKSATLGGYVGFGGGKTTAGGRTSTETGMGFGWGAGATYMEPQGPGGGFSCPSDSCYDERGRVK